jgi:uncharacterized protein YlxW (UPF0749 family)
MTSDDGQGRAEPTQDESGADELTGRDRLVAALKRPAPRAQLTAAILLAVLGFAGVVQVQSNDKDDTYAGTRQDQLVQLIDTLSLASQRSESEIAGLEQTRNSLRNDTDSRRTALDRAHQQANVLGILAGTLPAVGPGIRITVKDPNGLVGTDHLLDGLEELRDAGAEAIEMNDTVRVVAQTSLHDGPNGGVVVDGQQLSPPYTIAAIGDPHTLATGLNINGGFIADIEIAPVGGKVAVTQSDNIEIATTRQPTAPQYAQPAPTG